MTPKRRSYRGGGMRKRPDGRWGSTVDLGIYGTGRRRKYVYSRTSTDVVDRLWALQGECRFVRCRTALRVPSACRSCYARIGIFGTSRLNDRTIPRVFEPPYPRV